MQQPLGFKNFEISSLVGKFHKSLYGIKNVHRAWHEKIGTHFLKNGFKKCQFDPNIYVCFFQDDFLIVILCMDDLILTGNKILLI
jgi:hypothetical protein